MKALERLNSRFLSLLRKILYIHNPIIVVLSKFGFVNIYRSIVHGPKERIHSSKPFYRYPLALFNTRSGHINIGDKTIISHGCMFLTGRHNFEAGKLKQPKSKQVPTGGYDIQIGEGCWIASGVVVVGGVTIGDDCIVAAGAVVTKDFPSGCIIAGVPAKIAGYTEEL